MFLNGDETQIMLPPLQRGLWNVYQLGTVFPYGPLCNFLLHFMTFFGTGEWFFRMPSVLAGSVLCYVTYRWAAETFHPAAGLLCAVFLAFSENLIKLSAEVRHYMMHALLVACALYCLERAFRDQSLRWMRAFGLALLLALLTMYMSIWFTAGIGLYALVRIALERPPRRLVAEWTAFQAAAALLCLIAYTTHLHELRHSEGERMAREGWLRRSYFHPAEQDLFPYLSDTLQSLSGYVFSGATLGNWMLLFFSIGLVWLFVRRPGATRALLLILPVAATAASGVAGLYPFGGTRHDAFLAIFLATGAATGIALLLRHQLTLALLASLFFFALRPAEPNYLDVDVRLNRIGQMREMLAWLASLSPKPGVLVTDDAGSFTLRYYLCQGRYSGTQNLTPAIVTYQCAGYRIVNTTAWSVSEESLALIAEQARQARPDAVPGPIWLFSLAETGIYNQTLANENAGFWGRLHMRRISP